MMLAILKRHWMPIFAFILLIISHGGIYRVGIQHERDRQTIKTQQAIIERNEVVAETKEKVDNLSSTLSLSLSKINTNREETNEQINGKLNHLIHKYDDDWVYNKNGHEPPDGSTRISTTTKTSLGREILYWRLYEQDRRFLLQEAARADKTVNELNNCKSFINEIYDSHENYQKEMRLLKGRLKQ